MSSPSLNPKLDGSGRLRAQGKAWPRYGDIFKEFFVQIQAQVDESNIRLVFISDKLEVNICVRGDPGEIWGEH